MESSQSSRNILINSLPINPSVNAKMTNLQETKVETIDNKSPYKLRWVFIALIIGGVIGLIIAIVGIVRLGVYQNLWSAGALSNLRQIDIILMGVGGGSGVFLLVGGAVGIHKAFQKKGEEQTSEPDQTTTLNEFDATPLQAELSNDKEKHEQQRQTLNFPASNIERPKEQLFSSSVQSKEEKGSKINSSDENLLVDGSVKSEKINFEFLNLIVSLREEIYSFLPIVTKIKFRQLSKEMRKFADDYIDKRKFEINLYTLIELNDSDDDENNFRARCEKYGTCIEQISEHKDFKSKMLNDQNLRQTFLTHLVKRKYTHWLHQKKIRFEVKELAPIPSNRSDFDSFKMEIEWDKLSSSSRQNLIDVFFEFGNYDELMFFVFADVLNTREYPYEHERYPRSDPEYPVLMLQFCESLNDPKYFNRLLNCCKQGKVLYLFKARIRLIRELNPNLISSICAKLPND